MKREDLLKNQGYWTSKIQLDLYNQLNEYMRMNNLNRSELAKKLKVTKGYISQVLNGDFNHRLSKLVELSLAINKIPHVTFIDIDNEIINETDGYSTVLWQAKVKNSKPINTTSESKPVSTTIGFNTNSFYKAEIEATAI